MNDKNKLDSGLPIRSGLKCRQVQSRQFFDAICNGDIMLEFVDHEFMGEEEFYVMLRLPVAWCGQCGISYEPRYIMNQMDAKEREQLVDNWEKKLDKNETS